MSIKTKGGDIVKKINKWKGGEEGMGIVKSDDIRGYRIGGEIVCLEGITKEEKKELTEEDFILVDEVERTDDLYFCDRCDPKHQL